MAARLCVCNWNKFPKGHKTHFLFSCVYALFCVRGRCFVFLAVVDCVRLNFAIIVNSALFHHALLRPAVAPVRTFLSRRVFAHLSPNALAFFGVHVLTDNNVPRDCAFVSVAFGVHLAPSLSAYMQMCATHTEHNRLVGSHPCALTSHFEGKHTILGFVYTFQSGAHGTLPSLIAKECSLLIAFLLHVFVGRLRLRMPGLRTINIQM